MPRRIVTDRLRSYRGAKADIPNSLTRSMYSRNWLLA
nr:hypothetical protein [Paraburkholderia sp. BL6665CI2N2]